MKKEQNKNKKIIILVVILLLLALTSGIVATSYARYVSRATGTGDAKVATWAVQVNETNIVQNSTFALDSSFVTWSDSEYIADGYIAPSRTGTFKIKLDTTGSKVAVNYTIQIDTSSLDSYDQIQITKVNNQPLSGDSYSGIISLDDVDTPIEIPVEISWTNSDANNTSDTSIGSTVDTLSIPVTVTAEQYLGN